MHNTAMEQEICQYSESVPFFNCITIKEVSYLKENSQLSMTLKKCYLKKAHPTMELFGS